MNSANYTVIVAEDEELLLNNLIDKINNLQIGFEVIGKAQTGIQALELIEKLSPDLLITDIRMPVMDGIELLTKVRERFPLIKFIITSGFSDFTYAKSAIQLQVSEYLLKPIDPDELKEALSNLKNKFQLEQSTYEDIFNTTTTHKSSAQIAEILKEYIVHNYMVDINLNLIANNMNYSSSYLTKIFFQHYNTTPSKYMIALRMQKAQQLLLHYPEMSIRQVGEQIGYHDQGYFSRIFKKQVGVSPFDYREGNV